MTNWKIIAGVVAAVLVVGLSLTQFLWRPDCGTREEAIARLQEISSDLQLQASTGKISATTLSTAIRDLNSASVDFERTKDGDAFCKRAKEIQLSLPTAKFP